MGRVINILLSSFLGLFYSYQALGGELFSERRIEKIEIAKKAMRSFVKDYHIDGSDEGCISTFSSGDQSFNIVSNYGTNNEAGLIWKISNIGTANQTAFYDAAYKAANHALDNNRGQSPNIIILMTDGIDNGSRWSADASAEWIRDNFDSRPNTFGFVIGIGQTPDIDVGALNRFSKGAFPRMGEHAFHHINSIRELEDTFARVMHSVSLITQRQVGIARLGNMQVLHANQQQGLAVQRRAIKYQLCLDISASMTARELTKVIQCPGRGDRRCCAGTNGAPLAMQFEQSNSLKTCDLCLNSRSGSEGFYRCDADDIDICHSCEKGCFRRDTPERRLHAVIPFALAAANGMVVAQPPRLFEVQQRRQLVEAAPQGVLSI